MKNIKKYYKENKTIIEFDDKEYIGNFFEFNNIEREDFVFKLFDNKNLVLNSISISYFYDEFRELMNELKSVNFYLKNKFELLSIDKLNDNCFGKNNNLDILFSININISSKSTHRKFCIPFSSYYMDKKSNFSFYVKLNDIGFIDFYFNEKILDYNKFVRELIEMKRSKYSSQILA